MSSMPTAACAECGHLHFHGPHGYSPCPIEGCDCTGQEPARYENVTCPACKGTGGGWVNDCAYCDGNGVV